MTGHELHTEAQAATVVYPGDRSRAVCTCGWTGPWVPVYNDNAARIAREASAAHLAETAGAA